MWSKVLMSIFNLAKTDNYKANVCQGRMVPWSVLNIQVTTRRISFPVALWEIYCLTSDDNLTSGFKLLTTFTLVCIKLQTTTSAMLNTDVLVLSFSVDVFSGYWSGSSGWHESCCLQLRAVHVLLCLGHHPGKFSSVHWNHISHMDIWKLVFFWGGLNCCFNCDWC